MILNFSSVRNVAIAAVALVSGLANPVTAKDVIAPTGSSSSLPFSPAIRSGDYVYLSGTIPDRPGEGETQLSIEEQTRQVFQKLGKTLAAAGLDFTDVVAANVYLTSTADFQAMNGVFRETFSEWRPVRATVRTDLAIPGIGIEIALTAVRKGVEKKAIVPKGWKEPTSPYSWGIRTGDTFFLSGMVSRDPRKGELVEGDVTVQTRQVLRNIGELLAAEGLGPGDVVSSQVYLFSADDFQAMNAVYAEFFGKTPPARATVEAQLMNPALRVEIQCLAVRDPRRRVAVPEGLGASRSLLSPSIVAGGRQFLSGMVGRGPAGFAAGDVREQTRRTLMNLEATLKAAGRSFADVVEARVYLADVKDFAIMNEVYREYFPTAPPVRTTVGTKLMSSEALVEILLTAEVPFPGGGQ